MGPDEVLPSLPRYFASQAFVQWTFLDFEQQRILPSFLRPNAIVRDQPLRIPIARRDAGGGDLFALLFLRRHRVVEVEELVV